MPAERLALEWDDAVDFHLHTRASDGGWTPSTLVDHLADRGFRVAAICDHDTMDSVGEAMEHAARRGMVIVPGIEVTTFWEDRQWHLLVYDANPGTSGGAGFGALISRQQDALRAAAERAVVLLEAGGYRLPSLEDVVDGRPLLPVHVLQATIKDGHATNLTTAHELVKSLGESLRVDVPLAHAVAVAREAGGTCILAHPGRDDGAGLLQAEQLDRMLATIPVDGLEGHYRSYTDEDTQRFRALALERNLVVSAGSDSHAPGFPVDPRAYPAGWVGPFLRRLGFDLQEVDGDVWYPGAPDASKLQQATS